MSRVERPLICVGAVLVMAVMACSLLSGKTPTATPQTGGQEAATVASTAATTPTGQAAATLPPVEATETAAAPANSTIDTIQGLDALPSYRETVKLTVDSTDASGNPNPGSLDSIKENINSDKSLHIKVNLSGSLAAMTAGSGLLDLYTFGDASYLVTEYGGGQSTCLNLPSGQASLQGMLIKIGSVIGQIHDAKLVKKGETVNEVITDHYTFDQSNLTGSAMSGAQGDVWVAEDGNYVVKLTGTAVGAQLIMFSDPKAKITFDYQVDQVGEVAAIELPKSCGVLPADIPVPPNTKVTLSVSGMYTLQSNDTPKVVADFYRQQLPSLGWTAGSDATAGATTSLNFTKDARILAIMISAENGGTAIIITDK
jgi:hypothetical protein